MALMFDDFTTGDDSFDVRPATIDKHYQTGLMVGGTRSTTVNNAQSPHGTLARLEVGGAARLNLTLDADQYARLEVGYGLRANGAAASLGLNLHDGGADRIRTTISHLDGNVVNFNVVIYAAGGWSKAGQNVGAGEIEFRFADFRGPGGQDFTNVRHIIFIFQVSGSITLDRVETRAPDVPIAVDYYPVGDQLEVFFVDTDGRVNVLWKDPNNP
jgi:hypothetical protein